MPGWLACACTHVTPLFLNTYKRTTNCLLLFYNTLVYHNLCIQLFHTRAHIFPFSTRQTPQLDRTKPVFVFGFFCFFSRFFCTKKKRTENRFGFPVSVFSVFSVRFFSSLSKTPVRFGFGFKTVFFRFGSVFAGYGNVFSLYTTDYTSLV